MEILELVTTMPDKNINLGNINTDGGSSHIGDIYNNNNITNIILGLSSLLGEFNSQVEDLNILINEFKVKTALTLLEKIHLRVSDNFTVEDEKSQIKLKQIKSKIHFLKGICKREINSYTKEESAQEFTQAYKNNEHDNGIRDRACIEYINLSEVDKAIALANQIITEDEFNFSAWFVLVVTSKNKLNKLNSVPLLLKKNRNFQLSIIHDFVMNNTVSNFDKLKEYGLDFSNYESELNEVTFKNKTSWVMIITLLIAKQFNSDSSKYIAGEHFGNRDTNEIKIIVRVIQKFISSLFGTEIEETLSVQKFHLHYYQYILTPSPSCLQSALEVYDKINERWWYLTYCICQLLNHNKEYEKTIQILKQAEAEQNVLPIEFYHFKTVVNIVIENESDSFQSFSQYIKAISSFDNFLAINVLHTLFLLQEFHNFQKYWDDLNHEISTKDFEYDELRVFLQSGIDILMNGKDATSISELQTVKDCLYFDTYIRFYICRLLNIAGHRNDAIAIMETFLDREQVSEELRFYIGLLLDRLHDKDEETPNQYKDLLALLKFWREKSVLFDRRLCIAEHNLYVEINDFDSLYTVDKLLFDNSPENEESIYLYLITLERLRKVEEIEKITTNLSDNFKNEKYGIVVSGILLKNETTSQKGFNILFNLASDSTNIESRKRYVAQSFMLTNFLKKFETVTLGVWVRYSIDGKEDKIKINQETQLQGEFIGKSVGDKFTKKSSMVNEIHEVEILEIFDDGTNLFREILDETKNPLNELGFVSLQLPSNPSDFNQWLVERFGANGSLRKEETDQLLKDYFGYKIGFSEISKALFDSNFVDTYFFLTNGGKEIMFTTLPISVLSQNKLNESLTYSLDVSTILLFYSLEQQLGFKLRTKFMISYYLKEEIENAILECKHSPKAEMSLNISLKGVTGHQLPSNYRERRLEFLEALTQWIEDNCVVDLVEEKLNVAPKLSKHENIGNDKTMRNIIDNMHFSIRTNHRHISSDSFLFLYNLQSNVQHNIISPEGYLLQHHPELCSPELYRQLLKWNYVGINITYETLQNEFQDFLSGLENCYIQALYNLQFTINPNPENIKTATQFLKELYVNPVLPLAKRNFYALEFLRYVLNGMPPEVLKDFLALLQSEFRMLGANFTQVLQQMNLTQIMH